MHFHGKFSTLFVAKLTFLIKFVSFDYKLSSFSSQT